MIRSDIFCLGLLKNVYLCCVNWLLYEQQIFRILEKTDGFCSGLLYQEKLFLQMSLKRRVAI